MNNKERLSHHYKNIAGEYNDALFFAHGYRKWLVELIIKELEIRKKDFVVDLGGGTGIVSKMICDKVCLEKDVLCVDPSKEMLNCAAKLSGVSTLCSTALAFVQKEHLRYNKILIKEAVHHFENRMNKWNGIYRQLYAKGRLLIITRPIFPDFPFFKAALNSFKQCQPDYHIILKELEDAKFSLKLEIKDYFLKINKTRWFELIRQRFMSNLIPFTDEQLNSGIKELEQKYREKEILEFVDRLIFIGGTKR